MNTNPFAIAPELYARDRVDTSVSSVRSAAKLPAAMNALATCADVRRDVEKALAPSIDLISQARDAALEVIFLGKEVDLKVFESHLEGHVEDLCRRQGSKLFPIGARTRKFGRGTVLLRTGKERVESVHGLAGARLNAQLASRAREVVLSALEAVGLAGLVRVNIELDCNSALKASPEQLAEAGLRVGRGPDTVTITV